MVLPAFQILCKKSMRVLGQFCQEVLTWWCINLILIKICSTCGYYFFLKHWIWGGGYGYRKKQKSYPNFEKITILWSFLQWRQSNSWNSQNKKKSFCSDQMKSSLALKCLSYRTFHSRLCTRGSSSFLSTFPQKFRYETCTICVCT